MRIRFHLFFRRFCGHLTWGITFLKHTVAHLSSFFLYNSKQMVNLLYNEKHISSFRCVFVCYLLWYQYQPHSCRCWSNGIVLMSGSDFPWIYQDGHVLWDLFPAWFLFMLIITQPKQKQNHPCTFLHKWSRLAEKYRLLRKFRWSHISSAPIPILLIASQTSIYNIAHFLLDKLFLYNMFWSTSGYLMNCFKKK